MQTNCDFQAIKDGVYDTYCLNMYHTHYNIVLYMTV